MTEQGVIVKTIPQLQREAYETNVVHGFDPDNCPFERAIALMHSELSEALEEYRNEKPLLYFKHSDGTETMGCLVEEMLKVGLPKPEGIAAEYADVVIRILSDCEARGIDLYNAIRLKMAYNKTRPFRHGGKKI